MSKLKGRGSRARNERGSALVSVIALSIVMSIISVGYLATTGITVSSEVEALDNTRAFYAAESGLLVGTRWLADSANFVALATGTTNVFGDTINRMAVAVSVIRQGTNVVVRSEARGGSLAYVKRLEWSVRVATPFQPGVFINAIGSGGGPTVGGSVLNNVWFDGPFHANTPLLISSVSNPGAKGAGMYFVNGPVTVFNNMAKDNFSAGHWGNYGTGNNSYEYGVYHHNLTQNTDRSSKLDEFFSGTYTHSQDSIYMPDVTRKDIILPGSNPAADRPFIHYEVSGGIGVAVYHYYDGAGVKQTAQYAVNEKVIYAPQSVGVLGTVKGQTTLVTEKGASIYPVGDLVYDGFTADISGMDNYNNGGNYGIGTSAQNSNVIALVSGADIFFEQTQYAYNATTKALQALPGGAKDNTMFLTAVLIAKDPGRGTWWVSKDGTRHGDIEQNKYNYELRAIGSRTLDSWYSYNAGGTNSNELIRFFYDTRLADGVRAPGVPLFQTKQNDQMVLLFNSDWSETNIPL